jgi:hypothetical protein
MLNLKDSYISGVGISYVGGPLFAVTEKTTTVVEEIF